MRRPLDKHRRLAYNLWRGRSSMKANAQGPRLTVRDLDQTLTVAGWTFVVLGAVWVVLVMLANNRAAGAVLELAAK